MNKKQTKECIKVMQAFCDDAEVNFKGFKMIADSPSWNWDDSPETFKVKPREYWVAEFNSRSPVASLFPSRVSCESHYSEHSAFIKAIQLVEKDEN